MVARPIRQIAVTKDVAGFDVIYAACVDGTLWVNEVTDYVEEGREPTMRKWTELIRIPPGSTRD